MKFAKQTFRLLNFLLSQVSEEECFLGTGKCKFPSYNVYIDLTLIPD